MKSISIYLTAILLLLCFSCKQKSSKEKEAEFLGSVVSHLPVKSYKWVVILPGLGCHGCIQEAEVFMQKNISNKNILFVLTKVESLKILQNKINIRINEHPNVYFDKENIVRIPSDNSIYPCILQMYEGELQNYQFQAPYNSQAFAKLESMMDVNQPK